MNTQLLIEPMNIQLLLDKNFFIPSYQRGYRWSPQQIKDFLNDIKEFDPKTNEIGEKTWYCLQPLVIKPMDTYTKAVFNLDETQDWYEVIDGQQRLTTLFLVVHYINEMWKGKQKFAEFSLKYETRANSEDFLKQLEVNDATDIVAINDQNIDFHFISTAYNTIHQWVKGFGNSLNTGEFESKLIYNTKVIWYETDSDSVEVFTRINVGKIPLTNAELIKALFLNNSNFADANDKDKTKIRLKQLEIASEWDRMEYNLQNDSFWYFLNNKSTTTTRIEFIFDLIANKLEKTHDEFYTFRHFVEKLKDSNIKEVWKQVKQCFQVLEEWYNDRKLYHKVGFLVATGSRIKDIFDSSKGKSKSEFLNDLNQKIHDSVISKDDISTLKYRSEKIRPILLLHNIQTMLNNENETNRFPFDRFKKEKWDVEHITAIAEEPPQTDKHKRDWLDEVKNFAMKNVIKPELLDQLEIVSLDLLNFDEFYRNFLKEFEENKGEVDNINNLVLLDAHTNRSYKNAVFPIKRSTIIEREKAGVFVPISTKNVFMKFYSDDVSQMSFWGEKDKELYFSDLNSTINSVCNTSN